MAVQTALCQTWWETLKTGFLTTRLICDKQIFSRCGSYRITTVVLPMPSSCLMTNLESSQSLALKHLHSCKALSKLLNSCFCQSNSTKPTINRRTKHLHSCMALSKDLKSCFCQSNSTEPTINRRTKHLHSCMALSKNLKSCLC